MQAETVAAKGQSRTTAEIQGEEDRFQDDWQILGVSWFKFISLACTVAQLRSGGRDLTSSGAYPAGFTRTLARMYRNTDVACPKDLDNIDI